MKKSELITKIAKNANITQIEAKTILNIFLESVEATLKQEKKFFIANLGTFIIETRKSRIGRNPQTGEKIIIDSHKHVKFRPTKTLKARIR